MYVPTYYIKKLNIFHEIFVNKKNDIFKIPSLLNDRNFITNKNLSYL
jgi:hypothetical protein